MSSIAERTTDRPASPAWATDSDPDDCGGTRMANPAAVCHWSERLHASIGSGATFDVALVRWDDLDDPSESKPTRVHVEARRFDEPLTLDQLDTFARWLTARVSEYRHAIATEDGAL